MFQKRWLLVTVATLLLLMAGSALAQPEIIQHSESVNPTEQRWY
jgi:hypothetical protein